MRSITYQKKVFLSKNLFKKKDQTQYINKESKTKSLKSQYQAHDVVTTFFGHQRRC